MKLYSLVACFLVTILFASVAVYAGVPGPHKLSVVAQQPQCIADGVSLCGVTVRADSTAIPSSGVQLISSEYVLPSVSGYTFDLVSADLPFSGDFFEGVQTDQFSHLDTNPIQRMINIGQPSVFNREGSLVELYFTITPGSASVPDAQASVGLTQDPDYTYFVFQGSSEQRLPIIDVSQAEFTIVNPLTCPADIDDGSNTGTSDGGVDISDLLFFLSRFEAGSLDADLDDGTGTGVHDGGVDISDLLYFLQHFESGC